MTLRQLSVYLGHVPAITAREALTQSVVASMPYMDDDARAQVLQDWSAVAGDTPRSTADPIGWDDFTKDIKERIA